MSREQLAQRMLCSYGEIDAQRLRRGFSHRMNGPRSPGQLVPCPKHHFYIDDTAAISVMEMRLKHAG